MRDEIIKMAQEAGWRVDPEGEILEGDDWHIQTDIVERFFHMAQAAERANWPAEMEAMERQVNILTDELSKVAKWRNSAIRVGENLSTCGPEGYYDFTSAQWLGWALDATTKMQDDYMNLGACGEREACAKVCEEYHSPGAVAYVTDVAAAIRERNGNAS